MHVTRLLDDWPDDIGLQVAGGAPRAPDLEVLLAAVADQLGTDDAQVVATVAWKRYSFSVTAPAMEALGRHGWVPDISLANSVVTVSPVEPLVTVALIEPRVVDVADFSDIAQLTAALDPLLSGHLHHVIDELRSLRRVPRRGLDVMEHATVISSLASVFSLDDAFTKCGNLHAAIDPAGRKLIEIAELSSDAYARPMALRSACCLIYKADGYWARGGQYCATCNLLSDDERTELLAARGLRWRRLPAPPANHTTDS